MFFLLLRKKEEKKKIKEKVANFIKFNFKKKN